MLRKSGTQKKLLDKPSCVCIIVSTMEDSILQGGIKAVKKVEIFKVLYARMEGAGYLLHAESNDETAANVIADQFRDKNPDLIVKVQPSVINDVKIRFKRMGPGHQEMYVDGRHITTLYKVDYIGENRKQVYWYSDICVDPTLAVDLDHYTYSLRELKAVLSRAVREHKGKTLWHTPADEGVIGR